MVSLNYETIATNYIRFKQAERLKKTSFDLQIMNKQLGWVWVKIFFRARSNSCFAIFGEFGGKGEGGVATKLQCKIENFTRVFGPFNR